MPRRIAFALVGVVVSVVLGTGSASAGAVHVFSSSFGSAGAQAGEVSLVEGGGVAVNTSTHDVYVADTGNARVDQFSSTGEFIRAWGWGVADGLPAFESCTLTCQQGMQGSGAGQFTTPMFVAVDNSSGASAGDVYVGDTGTNTVSKFSASGAFISTNDGSSATAPVAGPFGALAGVTVDGSGNLWVYDTNSDVFEFAQDASFLTDWNSGRGVNPAGIDADSAGNVYVLTGAGTVEQFTAAGADVGPVNGDALDPTGFAFDRSSDQLYMDSGGSLVRHYEASCDAGGSCTAVDSFGSGQLNGAAGLAVDYANQDVYAVDPGNARIDTFAPAAVPDVVTGQASGVTVTTATLEGTVNAESTVSTDCHFAYVDDAHFDASEPDPYAAGQTASCASTPSGSSPVAVSADITGLTPGVVYHFRLSAANANGTVTGVDETFATGPVILSSSVANVTVTSADLRARINPYLRSTTYHFEYGTSTSYGQSTVQSASIGSDAEPHSVSVHIQGLAASTVYHYRVVASNSAAPSGLSGPDHTFITQSPAGTSSLPDGRGYELVTPVVKGDGALSSANLPFSLIGGFQASSSGDGLAYSTYTAFPGARAGGYVNYVAARGGSGWSSQDLTPPQATLNEQVNLSPSIMGFSADLSKAVFQNGGGGMGQDSPPLVPGEPQNNQNVFVRDNTTGAYQLADVTLAGATPALAAFQGASADYSHVFFVSAARLTPEAIDKTSTFGENLYQWAGGAVSLVSQIPVSPATRCGGGGPACVASPLNAGLGGGYGGQNSAADAGFINAVSPDGSKVFFISGEVPGAEQDYQIYMRENGSTTVEVSASQKSNGSGPGGSDPNGSRFVQSWKASADGSQAFFTSCEQLTNDSTAHSEPTPALVCGGGSDLYRYDSNSGGLTDLTVDHNGDPLGADVLGVLGTSTDGSYVYFVANGVLAGGASPGGCHDVFGENEGQCNLYVSHDGVVTFIARLANNGDRLDWTGRMPARVTPDGTHLVFESVRSLTGYDNAVSDGSSSCGPTIEFTPEGVTVQRGVPLQCRLSRADVCFV